MEEKVGNLRTYCNAKSRGLILSQLVPKFDNFLRQDEHSCPAKVEKILLPALETGCSDSNDHEFRMKCLDVIQLLVMENYLNDIGGDESKAIGQSSFALVLNLLSTLSTALLKSLDSDQNSQLSLRMIKVCELQF